MLEWRLGAGVFRIGLTFVRVLCVLIAIGIFIPGMSHVLGDIGGINRMYLGKIAAEDRAPGQEETRRIFDTSLRIVAIGQKVAQTLAAAEPVTIEAGHRQHVRNVD